MRYFFYLLLACLAFSPALTIAEDATSLRSTEAKDATAETTSLNIPHDEAHDLKGVDLNSADPKSEAPKRVIDPRKIWHYIRTFSRGNDDPYENQLAGGKGYETAEMDFAVVVREDKEKNVIEMWLESKNRLSTSQLVGARAALSYGILPSGTTNWRRLTPEEQQARFEKDTKAEARRVEEVNVRIQARKKELLALLESLMAKVGTTKASLEELKKLHAEVMAASQAKIDKLTALIEDAIATKKLPGKIDKDKKLSLAQMKELLVEQQEKLDGVKDVSVSKENKTNTEESVARLTKLVAKAQAAKKSPGKDPAADKLPIPHLKNLLKEEQAKLAEINKKLESQELADTLTSLVSWNELLTAEKKEHDRMNRTGGYKIESEESYLSSIQASLKRTQNELDYGDFSPQKPKPVDKVTYSSSPVEASRQFQPYRYEDEDFARSLYSGSGVSPKGKEMKSTVMLGTVPIPKDGENVINGTIALSTGSGGITKHRMAWKVNLKDGAFVDATIETSGGKDSMLTLVKSRILKPDGSTEENSADEKLLATKFQEKPASLR